MRRLERYVAEGIEWDREKEEKKKSPEDIATDSFDVISNLIGKTNAAGVKFTVGKNLFKIIKARQTESLPELIKNLEFLKKFTKTKEEREYLETQLRSLRSYDKNVSKTRKKVEEELEVKTKETYFLRKASSGDKQIIMNLNHSIKLSTKKIDGYILRIGNIIKKGGSIDSIIPWLDKISLENKKVKSHAKIVSVANFNLKSSSREDELIEYIKEYAETIIKGSNGLNLEFHNESIEYHTKFVPLEISTMLDNLIDNSIKAQANKISIRFEKRKEKMCMYFADNGKGIRKNDEQYLFTRGYTTTSGSGLGIYHVKSIAEEHGGSVRYVGNGFKGLGKGAVFEVILHKSN